MLFCFVFADRSVTWMQTTVGYMALGRICSPLNLIGRIGLPIDLHGTLDFGVNRVICTQIEESGLG